MQIPNVNVKGLKLMEGHGRHRHRKQWWSCIVRPLVMPLRKGQTDPTNITTVLFISLMVYSASNVPPHHTLLMSLLSHATLLNVVLMLLVNFIKTFCLAWTTTPFFLLPSELKPPI